jgi:tight adherence protein B
MPFLLATLLFAAIALAGFASYSWTQESATHRETLRGRLRKIAMATPDNITASLLRDQRLSSIPLLNTLLQRTPLVVPLVAMIRQAGLRRRVGEVILYIPLLATIGLLAVLLFGGPWPVALGLAGFLALLPIIIVARIRSKRLHLFQEQLPDALDLVRSALQAGHGLVPSMQVAGESLPDPVAMELRYVVDEVRLGLTLRDALYHLSDRVGDPNVPLLIVGILVSQEVGGNLAEVIDNTAITIRERAKLQRDIRVFTAQSRFSAAVLTFPPSGWSSWRPSTTSNHAHHRGGNRPWPWPSLIAGHLSSVASSASASEEPHGAVHRTAASW